MAKKIASIEDLKEDPRQVRVHDERAQEAVARSLSTYGAGRSVVADRDGGIIGGHNVIEQAKALGLGIKVVQTTGDEVVVVQRMDLDPNDPRRRGLAIADNRTADLSEFDPEKLTSELRELASLGPDALNPEATGFSSEEVGQLLAAYPVEEPQGDQGGQGDGGDGDDDDDGGDDDDDGDGGPAAPPSTAQENRRDPREPRVVTCPHCHEPFELPE